MPAILVDNLQDSGNDVQPTEPRIQVMTVILLLSFLAVSFPGASNNIPFLRIPHIIFFLGKHFGTGVILATAFIHLLQDSFEALQRSEVKEYFDHVGKYTGLIILASLLSIFLVEYLSMSYVDHLHTEPSPQPTPISSRPPSPERSHTTVKCSSLQFPAQRTIIPSSTNSSWEGDVSQAQLMGAGERLPLLHAARTPHVNHPHAHSNHHAHHALLPALATQDPGGVLPIDILTNSPRIIKMRGCVCVVGHICACSASAFSPHPPPSPSKDPNLRHPPRSTNAVDANMNRPISNSVEEEEVVLERNEGMEIKEAKSAIGRRRQVVGLLVLQLGIMIHSLVIGLTLAITTGADFTSLTTAVIFHQIFEGLSLGIRIAALPPPSSCDSGEDVSRVLNKSDVAGDRGCTKAMVSMVAGERGEGLLKCTLAILFAIMTPVGMGLGMIAFKVGKKKEGIELARMYLTQGLMSAISAGMLIYVSTVEMIAGDFVFGDVEGHGHHNHGHSHDIPSTENDECAQANQAKLGPSSNGMTTGEEASEEMDQGYNHHHHHHGRVSKKVIAVLSLLAGVGCMVVIGLGE